MPVLPHRNAVPCLSWYYRQISDPIGLEKKKKPWEYEARPVVDSLIGMLGGRTLLSIRYLVMTFLTTAGRLATVTAAGLVNG